MLPIARDRVFRDPVHGLIEFRGARRPLANLLDTRAMQRLRRIRQMGWASLVYPGAEHTRFGHALGAYHVASRVVDQLRLGAGVAQHVLVAALLHDVGHGPFSHAWEHVFSGSDHEQWGARILREDPELRAALNDLEPGLAETLSRFATGDYQPQFARKLVSSQLDVDRLDYLLRDGHYSGAGYATFDLDWIVHALQIEQVRDDANDPSDLVVDYRRGMYAVEQYLFARSYMYAQVYHHKTVRAAEWLFIKTMERFAALARAGIEPAGLEVAATIARGATVSVAEYMSLHDGKLLTALDNWAGFDGAAAADPTLRDLAARLVKRRLFKSLELGDDPRVVDKVAPQALAIAQKRYGDMATYYVQVDTAQQGGSGVSGGGDELHVVDHPRYGTVTLSRLLEDMPIGHPVAAVRLIAAPELIDELRPLADSALPKPRGRR